MGGYVFNRCLSVKNVVPQSLVPGPVWGVPRSHWSLPGRGYPKPRQGIPPDREISLLPRQDKGTPPPSCLSVNRGRGTPVIGPRSLLGVGYPSHWSQVLLGEGVPQVRTEGTTPGQDRGTPPPPTHRRVSAATTPPPPAPHTQEGGVLLRCGAVSTSCSRAGELSCSESDGYLRSVYWPVRWWHHRLIREMFHKVALIRARRLVTSVRDIPDCCITNQWRCAGDGHDWGCFIWQAILQTRVIIFLI